MKSIAFIILLFSSPVILANGIFADGFQPSNWGEAIRHVHGRIQSAHSGGQGADLSALENFTTEDYERLYMYELKDPEAKKNDPRREVIKEWSEFSLRLENSQIDESDKEDIQEYSNKRITDLTRQVEKGLHYDRWLKRDACLISCRNDSDVRQITCYQSEIESRESCEEMSFINPKRLVCHYKASEEQEQCSDDSSWSYQVCQSECY